ncbi:homeodomain-like superfamily protein isoform X2 [Wolffia australiana]
MSFESDLFDDIFPESSHAPVPKLGKFQPKTRKKTEKNGKNPSADHAVRDDNATCEDIIYSGGNQESSLVENLHDMVGFRSSPASKNQSIMASEKNAFVPSSHASGKIDALPSECSPEPTRNEQLEGHEMDFQTQEMSSDFDLESLDAILSQRDGATDPDAILPIHGVNFHFDHESLQGAGDSGLADDMFELPPSSSGTRVESKFQPRLKPRMKKEGITPSIASDSLSERDGKTSSFNQKETNVACDRDRIGEELPTEVDGEALETDLFDDDDVSQAYMQLRNRSSDVNQNGGGNGEVWGINSQRSNDSQFVREDNDGMLFKKKPVQHVRNPLSVSNLHEDTHKRKFSHYTRKRRRVDKILAETAEEDIDPMKLKIKDLIMLAEARERKTAKEAAETKLPEKHNSLDGEAGDRPVKIRLNYHTYMNKPRSERWSKMDTDLFYKAVRQFGTDFAMIQQLFPNRTRHQIKLKFKNEERKHPLQIADAVVHRSKDHSHFELVIERLKAHEEEARDSADAGTGPAESEIGDENGGEGSEKKEELEVDDWDQQADDPEEQDLVDWTQYDISASEPAYGTDKSGYDDDFF